MGTEFLVSDAMANAGNTDQNNRDWLLMDPESNGGQTRYYDLFLEPSLIMGWNEESFGIPST